MIRLKPVLRSIGSLNAPPLKAAFDAREDKVGEAGDLGADEGGRYGDRHQYGDNLRNEGERDLLHLGECLKEGNADPDKHRHEDRGPDVAVGLCFLSG